MICTETIHHAPLNSGDVVLGRTLPSLLDEACDRTSASAQAYNQWSEAGWQSLSNHEFQTATETVALGLLSVGLTKGDRVALLMHSDINFCITDFGCLLANLIDVPIDLTQTLEHIIFVLRHSEAKALIISNLELLAQLMPYFSDTPDLQHIIIVNVSDDWHQTRSQWMTARPNPNLEQQSDSQDISESACLCIPMFLHPAYLDQPHSTFPQCIQVFSLDEIRQQGQIQFSAGYLQHLRTTLEPHDLATLIYIPDEMGQLQGVMLTHENLSANALAAFAAIPGMEWGMQETVLSFLPLNHVLARTLLYGHIYYGHSIYFSNPNHVTKHLKEIQPTILVTVPLMLEKIYGKILEQGNRVAPLKRVVFQWALAVAKQFEVGHRPGRVYGLQLKLADWLVLSRWRSLFGDRLKFLICGGAALSAEIATVFAAAGMPILQGYGLTQASAVVCCNRGALNRAGTVGMPIAGVEIAIAADNEILVRSPYVTPGYYKNPEATEKLIDSEGWLHTGDLGVFTEGGFLKITGLKKALFKLSTGKYIAPQPIEQRLKQSPLVADAIAVGSERKFCTMLIFPNLSALHHHAQLVGFDLADNVLLNHPCTLALYQSLVDAANCHLPYWATVKRFQLINASLTAERELLTPDGQVDRAKSIKVFANEIAAMYAEKTTRQSSNTKKRRAKTTTHTDTSPSASSPQSFPTPILCPLPPTAPCPAIAQSLNSRLTT